MKSSTKKCGKRRGERACTFPVKHPGVCSWDVMIEPIYHATAKPAAESKP